MELTIEHTQEQPLLKRSQVQCRIVGETATPSRLAVAQAVAEKLKVKQENVVVQHIHSAFGKNESYAECIAYTDEALLKRLERDNLLAKHVAPEPEPAAAEPQAVEAPAADAEDAPVEEPQADEAPAEESAAEPEAAKEE